MACGCISPTSFLPLAVPEWWSHIQILSERYWDQLARSATSIARGGLGCVSGVLGPWIFKSADLRSSHARFPGTLFNLRCLIRCAVSVKATGCYLSKIWGFSEHKWQNLEKNARCHDGTVGATWLFGRHVPGSSPGGSRVIRRWGWNWRPRKKLI